jgi:hypothetical protein
VTRGRAGEDGRAGGGRIEEEARRLAASFRHRGRRTARALAEGTLAAGLKICRRLGAGPALASPLRRGLWAMNRNYRPDESGEGWAKDFKDLLSRVATGDHVAPEELLPYLCAERLEDRAEANAMLADAFAQVPEEGRLRQARVFAERAWLLSGGAERLLPLYVRTLSVLRDAAGVRAAYKRALLSAARRGDFGAVNDYFFNWQYAFYLLTHADRYEFDFEVLAAVDEMAAPHRFRAAPRLPAGGKRVRVAHLVKGITELKSILVQIDLVFAKYHDRARFETTFFVPESERQLKDSAAAGEHVRQFEELGCRVTPAPDADDDRERLLGLARRIHDERPHLLVTSAALADFNHYFITSLRPAPVCVGLVQGPPQQFAPPSLDWGIAWTKHPLMDAPINCSLVEIHHEWPGRGGVEPLNREELGVPETACVLLSGGRYTKFQDAGHWRAVGEVLAAHPEAFYVVAGAREEEIPALGASLAPEVRARVRCLGWRPDFLRLLGAADVVIDTYPSGGGQVIVQAMSAGLPVVSHRNDYLRPFDQADWSPVEDFLDDPDTVVPRGDFRRFREVLSRLIEDAEYRSQVGARARAQHAGRANPEPAIRRCEEIYLKVLEQCARRAAGGEGQG